MMLALWFLPAHHLQWEKNKQKLRLADLHGVMTANTLLLQVRDKIITPHGRVSPSSIQRHLPKVHHTLQQKYKLRFWLKKWEPPSAMKKREMFAVRFSLDTIYFLFLPLKVKPYCKRVNSTCKIVFIVVVTLYDRGRSDLATKNKIRHCFVTLCPCLKCYNKLQRFI